MAVTSAKSVIEAGIIAGKSVAFILGQVAKKVPDSKADESHVRFYANKMVREETLDKDIAQDKYGCGARGRKPAKAKSGVSTTPVKAKKVKAKPAKAKSGVSTPPVKAKKVKTEAAPAETEVDAPKPKKAKKTAAKKKVASKV